MWNFIKENVDWVVLGAAALGLLIAVVGSVRSANAEPWTPQELNQHIDSTNFIVGRGCSGTLIDLEERLILTNHHCIVNQITKQKRQVVDEEGAISHVDFEKLRPVEVSQRTYDGHNIVSESKFITEILGYNKDTDLAVLQFRSKWIPHTVASELYSADEPIVRGQTIYVVGNPLGLDASVTKGIISSTNRLVQVGFGDPTPYYQVDAGVVGGNSGGALYTEDGFLIGVPGAADRSGGIGLAIPYPFINELLDEIFAEEEVEDKAVEE